jgi:hypothetical protein
MGARSAFSFAPGLQVTRNVLARCGKFRFNLYRHFADQGKP